jgi:hypothetical protein
VREGEREREHYCYVKERVKKIPHARTISQKKKTVWGLRDEEGARDTGGVVLTLTPNEKEGGTRETEKAFFVFVFQTSDSIPRREPFLNDRRERSNLDIPPNRIVRLEPDQELLEHTVQLR